MSDRITDVCDDLRGDNSNLWHQFWNENSHGRDQAKSITDEYPELEWYPDRAALIAKISGNTSGSTLKKRQYELSEYAQTKLGEHIQPIADLVHQKFKQLRMRYEQ